MKAFGVIVSTVSNKCFVVPREARYQSPRIYYVEGDASSASYFLAAGAITRGPVTVSGVPLKSIQGDIEFVKLLAEMGAIVRWDGTNEVTVSGPSSVQLVGLGVVDCGHIPDCAMTLAVVALFASSPTTLTNIGSWRVKECDRLTAMATELRKFGAVVEEGADSLTVHPPVNGIRSLPPASVVTVSTYNDHRMAMCFSLLACAGIEVEIQNPDCTSKTYPNFFQELFKIFETK